MLNDPGVLDFIDLAKSDRDARPPLRAARLSLDLLDTRSPRQFEERLALAVRRLAALPVNTVLLAGYADADRDGTADAAYFPTRVMGVKRDILNHVVQRLHAAGLEVFVSLPVLSFTRPATTHNDSLLVMETRAGAVRPATGIQRRLSPFHPEAAALMQQVYRDLAAHVPLDGIVFEDDAFLTDREDWNPAAQAACRAELGFDPGQVPSLTEADSRAWTALKTRTLSAFVRALADEVRRYRPDLRTVRALYAPVVNRPRAEDWLAQNFDESIEQHDYVLVEAHVELQDVSRPERWLRELVEVVGERPDGLGRTVFDLQAYDWERGRWVRDRDIGERLEVLRAAGAAHLAYGPDDPVAGRPDAKTLATGLAPAR